MIYTLYIAIQAACWIGLSFLFLAFCAVIWVNLGGADE